ncbi:actin cortical patch SUR7/pH-response regulator pali [Lactarius indigo]|nr:actin cortical patch SUR7/pH-response regulator pali [Lactarius indigo]
MIQQYKLRGEICIGFASLFSFAAVLLLIFVHVGQTSTSSVPRGIAMAKMNVSQYGQTLAQGLGDPITGLYAANASAPLQKEAGIRQVYKFGLYSYCGYLNTSGTCTNTTIANKYQPYDALLADMSSNYSALTIYIINGTSSFESQSMASHTRSAYYLILVGTVCAFLALVIGVFKRTLAFLASACFAIIATAFVLTGAALWTSAINSSESVNGLILNTTDIPLGIEVSSGSGLSLLWAAVGCLFASLIPYLISCCTFRG